MAEWEAKKKAKAEKLAELTKRLETPETALKQPVKIKPKPKPKPKKKPEPTKAAPVGPQIEVTFLNCKQVGDFTQLAVRIRNASSAFLSHVKVNVTASGKDGEYLGSSFAIEQNVQPGQSRVSEVLYADVRSSAIATWRPSLGTMAVEDSDGKMSFGAERHFTLKIMD